MYPVEIVRTSSPYNRDIRVRLRFGLPELWINGALQSGPGYAKLWELAFEDMEPYMTLGKRRNVLFLGIGGANAIHLLRLRNARTTITAVDIDSEVIDLSKRYFGLSDIPNQAIICEDADAFLTRTGKSRRRFDLVIVDVYTGYDIPSFLESTGFPAKLWGIMADNGTAVLNYTPEGDLDGKARLMLDKLRKVFHSVYSTSVYSNRFICAVR